MIKQLANFVKITIAGGMLFLIPLIVIIIVVAKAFTLLRGLSKIVADRLHFTQMLGIGATTLISIVLLLLICFLAGIVMRTKFAKKIILWLEDRVLVFIPGYSYIRARSSDLLSKEKTDGWKPATIFVDDNEVICFVIDETNDFCSIFLPSAPMPSSGSICVREKAKVTFLPIKVSEAIAMIRQFGKGASSSIDKVQNEVFENRK